MNSTSSKIDGEPAVKKINTPVHPQLIKKLRVEAIESDSTISEIIHDILCDHYDLKDLPFCTVDKKKVAAAS